jgi:hypothetical protein
MFSGGGGGEGTPSFASLASYGGSDIEASSSLVWRGVFTASDTANHQFGFHVERMTLALEDSAGLYDMSNPLVAELSGQIRFGLGTGPLSPSDALYEFTAQLLAGGTWSDFNLINVLNPTGAQLPNFTESNFGTFHQALAPAFDAVLNLGVIPGGQSFTLEYWASTFVGSPGVVIDPNGILYGEARFGDPFNVNAPTPDQFRFQTAPVNEIPEPSTLLIFSLLGGVLTGTIIQHQRRASG